MKIEAKSVNDYFDKIPLERKEAMTKIRDIINSNLPREFEEQMGYGMPSWVVPHSVYPKGYHVTPNLPLPFMSLALQKKFIGLYHMGIYAENKLHKWWTDEYAKRCSKKLDMGKSCIRLKYLDDIPYELIAELCTKISVDKWIEIYESNIKK
jgi:uncharacterized protein YdhG (YjbR/CyaY superfamily)